MLEILEMRSLPSVAYGAALVAAAPSAAIDFTPVDKILFKQDLKVYLHAADGTEFKETFSIEANTQPVTIRDLVLKSMQNAGWDAAASGTLGIVVSKHGGSLIDQIGILLVDYNEKFQPAISHSEGVKEVAL